jgi:DNA primase large subunit
MGIDYSKYPFLTRLNDYFSAKYKYVPSLDVILENNRLKELVVERIVSAVRGRVFLGSNNPSEDLLTTFHVSILVIKEIGSKWLQGRFANYEAERSYRFLQEEDSTSMIEILRAAGVNVGKLSKEFKLLIGRTRSGREVFDVYDYVIGFQDYLRYTKRFWGDSKWKLVNRLLSKGYVYVKKEELARIGKEVFYDKIMKLFEEIELVPGGELISDLASKVKNSIPSKYYRTEETLEGPRARGIVTEAFPPCIKKIYDAMLKGENLSHHERFAIATFLIALGASTEYIVDLFRNLPDFNEKITRYQIEHLAGKKGSGKRYSPYNCENMRSRGLCVADCGVKHPLSYYYRELRKLKSGRDQLQSSHASSQQ